jgi:hypothetical protein
VRVDDREVVGRLRHAEGPRERLAEGRIGRSKDSELDPDPDRRC